MKRTFLLIYTTVSGTTYKEFKTFQDGPDYDTCVQRMIDEFDELAYLFLKDDDRRFAPFTFLFVQCGGFYGWLFWTPFRAVWFY